MGNNLHSRHEETRTHKAPEIPKQVNDDVSASFSQAGHGAAEFQNIKNSSSSMVENKSLPNLAISGSSSQEKQNEPGADASKFVRSELAAKDPIAAQNKPYEPKPGEPGAESHENVNKLAAQFDTEDRKARADAKRKEDSMSDREKEARELKKQVEDFDKLLGKNGFDPVEAIRGSANLTSRDFNHTLDDLRHSNYGSAIKDALYTGVDVVATIMSPVVQTAGIVKDALSDKLDKLDMHK